MKVYAMNINAVNPDDAVRYGCLTERRAEKIRRLKNNGNKAQSICAQLLLNYAVNGDIHVPAQWDTRDGGKPYLTNRSNIHFNLSHSGEYAVCAVHDKSVGIDIQYKDKYDMDTADRFFTAGECEYIRKAADAKDAFYEIWTKKESFLKAVGRGITVPLDSFSVLGGEIEYGKTRYRFKEYRVSDARYKMYVCYSV